MGAKTEIDKTHEKNNNKSQSAEECGKRAFDGKKKRGERKIPQSARAEDQMSGQPVGTHPKLKQRINC